MHSEDIYKGQPLRRAPREPDIYHGKRRGDGKEYSGSIPDALRGPWWSAWFESRVSLYKEFLRWTVRAGFDSRHAGRRPGGNKCQCVQASIPDTKPVQFRQLHVRKHIKRS